MYLAISRLAGLAPVLGFLLLGLAGCGVVPFSTQLKLRKFDALNFDPAAPRLAVVAPDYLRIVPGSAKLTLSDQTKVGRDDVFTLQTVNDPVPGDLLRLRGEDERIVQFRLAAADLPRVRALQAEHAARKAAGTEAAKVDLKADIAACRMSALPFGNITGSVYIKTDDASDYLPLMQSVNLRDLAKSAGTRLEDEVQPCPAGQK